MLVPRDYQIAAINSLYRYFETHPVGHPVIALPTGTGKSVVIAKFLERAFNQYPHQKAICATHVKELIQQNYDEFLGIWPTAPAGIYSAGLKKKEIHAKITFAGVASIAKNIHKFGKIDLFLIDECHLLSPNDESMYMKVINFLLTLNPYMKVIGLSATPWREGLGKITDGGTIFTDICFDATDMVSFNWFIKEGYLAPLIPKRTKTILDVTGVHMQGGDFKESELHIAVDKDEVTFAALQEAVADCEGRKHWLVFGAGIKHVLKITEMLTYLGISTRCVHSKMLGNERDKNIEDWKNGKYTAIVNNGILTTGINFKAIDYIIVLRPTASAKLWVQLLGRGTRPLYADGFDLTIKSGRLAAIEASEKQNCLVKDFSGNTKRLGPINDPVLPRKRGEKTGEVPIKECDACGMYNHISARFCGGEPFKTNEGCGAEFHFKSLVRPTASTEELIKTDLPVVETFQVQTVTYQRHVKVGKPDSVRVSYYCGFRKFNEFVLFEHPGFGKRKAMEWWSKRSQLAFPEDVNKALDLLETFDPPTHIRVWVNRPYPEIMAVCFMGEFADKPSTDEVPF